MKKPGHHPRTVNCHNCLFLQLFFVKPVGRGAPLRDRARGSEWMPAHTTAPPPQAN
jgi:hypothetical protein